jgi:hypothetical protein
VVGVLEDNDGGPLGVVAGDLDRVLHGLGPAVHKHGLLGEVARRQAAELVRQPDGGLVRAHHEAGVGEFIGLGLDGRHHPGMAVADVHHGDAAAEIDVVPALHVAHDRTPGGCDVHGGCARHPR